MFGLSDDNIREIKEIISQFDDVEESLIFGSRAIGTHKKTSDIDLVLKGESVKHSTIIEISSKLNDESFMPYLFDVINFNNINNKALLEHIEQYGIKI